jgi:hypothetical protein
MTDATFDAKIDDFITGYSKQATLTNGVVILAHNGDAVTLTLAEPYTKATFHKRTEERINRRRTTSMFGNYTESKETVAPKDEDLSLDSTTGAITIINNKERIEKDSTTYTETFYDYNIFITLKEAYYTPTNEDGTAGAETKAGVTVVTPPASSDAGAAGYDYTPWIIGIIVLVVAAALIYWFFLRGRTVFGHTFGAPKAKAVVAAPAAPAPAPASAAPAQGAK